MMCKKSTAKIIHILHVYLSILYSCYWISFWQLQCRPNLADFARNTKTFEQVCSSETCWVENLSRPDAF